MKNDHQINIPLLFLFFAFFIILCGVFLKTSFQKDSSIQPSPPSPQKNIKPLNKLNYNLPILCDYQTKDSSTSAAVDANSIAATVMNNKSIQKYIIQGDCLYSWNAHEPNGTKKCGIGNFVTMGKQLLGSGIGSIESLTGMLPKSEKIATVDFQAVLESCKNVREIKKEAFVIPKGIKFE